MSPAQQEEQLSVHLWIHVRGCRRYLAHSVQTVWFTWEKDTWTVGISIAFLASGEVTADGFVATASGSVWHHQWAKKEYGPLLKIQQQEKDIRQEKMLGETISWMRRTYLLLFLVGISELPSTCPTFFMGPNTLLSHFSSMEVCISLCCRHSDSTYNKWVSLS